MTYIRMLGRFVFMTRSVGLAGIASGDHALKYGLESRRGKGDIMNRTTSAVIFDMDDTLVATADIWRQAEIALLDALGQLLEEPEHSP